MKKIIQSIQKKVMGGALGIPNNLPSFSDGEFSIGERIVRYNVFWESKSHLSLALNLDEYNFSLLNEFTSIIGEDIDSNLPVEFSSKQINIERIHR